MQNYGPVVKKVEMKIISKIIAPNPLIYCLPQHMNTTETQIRNTKGRFFGVTLKSGETFNAQLRGETSKMFKLYDRNDSRQRKVLKRSIMNVNCR